MRICGGGVFENPKQLADYWIKDGRVKDDDLCIFPDVFSIQPYSGFFRGMNFCTIGSMSYLNSVAPSGIVDIGKYCSIASGLSFLGRQHQIDYVTTSSCVYDKNLPLSNASIYDSGASNVDRRLYDVKAYNQDGLVHIGHDVWIGGNVTIKRGIKIGNGAIVAANSLVTKDVPPYSIVGGVPAKIIKMRFSDEIISDLMVSEWWNYSYSDICYLSLNNPKIFVKELSYLKKSFKTRTIEAFTEKTLKEVDTACST